MPRVPTKISKTEMLKAIRKIINIGKSGLILITIRRGKRWKEELRIVKDEDWFKEIYTEEFIKKLEELEEEVRETWEEDGT